MKTKLALIENGMISQIRQYIIEGKTTDFQLQNLPTQNKIEAITIRAKWRDKLKQKVKVKKLNSNIDWLLVRWLTMRHVPFSLVLD